MQMSQLRRLLILVFAVFMVNQAYSNHIIGSDMTYVMTDRTSSTFTIDVTTTIFRDAYQNGAQGEEIAGVEELVEVAIYRRSGNNWVLVLDPFLIEPDADEEELRLRGNICFDNSLLPQFEAGKTSYTQRDISLDVIDEDYLIVFQKCCRSLGITNIIDSGNTGSVTSIILSPEVQRLQNSNPLFSNDPEIVICNQFEQIIDVSATDSDGDDIVYAFFKPQTAGGPNGDTVFNPCPTRNPDCIFDCDGLIPDPRNCGPELFEDVNYNVGFNEMNPISAVVPFQLDSSTGIIRGTANRAGIYLIGVVAEEFRNGIKIGETRRDFNITVTDCNALAVIGPPNGSFDQFEGACSTNPFQVNTVQNSCGETNVQVENYTNLDPLATPFMWTIFEDDGTTVVGTNDLEWTPTFSLGLGRYVAEFAIFPDEICRAFCRYEIEVSEELNVDFDALTGPPCSGSPVTIDNISSIPLGYLYSWDFGNGTSSSSPTPPPISYTSDGDYEIKLIISDAICQDSSSETITYLAPPQPISITASSGVECVGEEIVFTNDIPLDYTVQWNFDDGTVSDELTPMHTYRSSGTYDVSLDVTTPNTCTTSITGPSIQIADLPSADFSVLNPAVCTGDPVMVTGPIAASGVTYAWDFGDGTSSTDRDPGIVNYMNEGQYTINLTVDDGLCQVDSSQMVSYFLPPDAFTVRPSEFVKCSPADIDFENTLPTTSVYSAFWDFGDGSTSTELSPTHTYGRSGDFDVRFQLLAPDGQVCSQEDWPLTIIEGPDADFTFSPNPVLNPNEVVRFFNQSTPSSASFEWDFGDGDGSTEDDPSHVFGFPDNYEVFLVARSAINNCVDTAFAIVPVSSSGAPAYPNAFRPTGGQNNEFKGASLFSAYIEYNLSVWDRWGQKVFETGDPDEGWNGRKDNTGTLLPQGVYVYKANFSVDVAGDVMEQQTNGTVLLLN